MGTHAAQDDMTVFVMPDGTTFDRPDGMTHFDRPDGTTSPARSNSKDLSSTTVYRSNSKDLTTMKQRKSAMFDEAELESVMQDIGRERQRYDFDFDDARSVQVDDMQTMKAVTMYQMCEEIDPGDGVERQVVFLTNKQSRVLSRGGDETMRRLVDVLDIKQPKLVIHFQRSVGHSWDCVMNRRGFEVQGKNNTGGS